MTVMTASMVAKYCAIEEMNGRVNPALSDSEDELENLPVVAQTAECSG